MVAKIIKKYENRLQMWEEKAKSRGAENRGLKKRQKNLEKGRDFHRAKWQEEREKSHALKAEIKELKKQLLGESISVEKHSYDLEAISLCLSIKSAGTMSYATCQSVLKVMCNRFSLDVKIPDKETIRLWSLKYS